MRLRFVGPACASRRGGAARTLGQRRRCLASAGRTESCRRGARADRRGACQGPGAQRRPLARPLAGRESRRAPCSCAGATGEEWGYGRGWVVVRGPGHEFPRAGLVSLAGRPEGPRVLWVVRGGMVIAVGGHGVRRGAHALGVSASYLRLAARRKRLLYGEEDRPGSQL